MKTFRIYISWIVFPLCFTHNVLFQHAPTFSLTHAIYLLIFGRCTHTHVHRCCTCSIVSLVSHCTIVSYVWFLISFFSFFLFAVLVLSFIWPALRLTCTRAIIRQKVERDMSKDREKKKKKKKGVAEQLHTTVVHYRYHGTAAHHGGTLSIPRNKLNRASTSELAFFSTLFILGRTDLELSDVFAVEATKFGGLWGPMVTVAPKFWLVCRPSLLQWLW